MNLLIWWSQIKKSQSQKYFPSKKFKDVDIDELSSDKDFDQDLIFGNRRPLNLRGTLEDLTK